MNIQTSTIRGFFEILMPGIFLLVNIWFTLYIIAGFDPIYIKAVDSVRISGMNSAVIIFISVVFGYPIGVVLRLLKCGRIDEYSAKFRRMVRRGQREERFVKDCFFYGNWMYEKCLTRLPLDVTRFYEEYWKDKFLNDSYGNTTFFNFCKTVIGKYDTLAANEIFGAENLQRFVAGSAYALLISLPLVNINIIMICIGYSWKTAILPSVVGLGYLFLLLIILYEYRLLRCKEVDTVFNACYTNKEYFEKLMPDVKNRLINKECDANNIKILTEMLIDSWKLSEKRQLPIKSLSLNKLTEIMREKSIDNPYLSSIYFAGSDVDHPFFLENDKLALGLAILPEDRQKAEKRKKHPHQTEIIIVLEGSLILHYLDKGEEKETTLEENDHFVIPKDTCHWISCNNRKTSVYLFVKTNPSQEPRGQECF